MKIARLSFTLLVATFLIVCGCGKRRDLIMRAKQGEAVTTFVIRGYTNGVPIRLNVTDKPSVTCLWHQLQTARVSDQPILGYTFVADITLTSGHRESVDLFLSRDGQEFSIGVNAAFMKEPSWYIVTIPSNAPASLTALFQKLLVPSELPKPN